MIIFGVGSPGTVGPASGGKVTANNLITTTPAIVIAANPSRASITFHNPGGTVTLYVAPVLNAQGQSLVVGLGALGGSFQLLPGGLLTLSGEVQGAWQAFAASGSNPLTIMESNLG